jgi:homoserine/homoserine lactone efflux protein
MHLQTFLLYVLTESALSLSPGPAVMLVVASSLTQGSRRAIWSTLGILTANALYFAFSASGLGSLLNNSFAAFRIVQYLGAAYLVYLGARALLGKPSPLTIARADASAVGRARLYRSGLLLQLGNPKSLLFFIAILPQFIDPHRPVAGQMIWLAAGSIIPEFAILFGYAFLAARASVLARGPRFARWTERCAGGLMIGAAALLASAQR